MAALSQVARAFVVALCGVSAAQAQAQPPSEDRRAALSQEYDQCLAGAESNAAMHRCVGAEAARWDARLNAAYQAILAAGEFDARGKAELREAQRAWLEFRDKTCIAEGDLFAAGGTASPLIAADCALTQTARRAADLERIRRSGARASP